MDLNKCRNLLLDAIGNNQDDKINELANEIGKPVDEVKGAISKLKILIDLKARQMRVSRRNIIRGLRSNKLALNKL